MTPPEKNVKKTGAPRRLAKVLVILIAVSFGSATAAEGPSADLSQAGTDTATVLSPASAAVFSAPEDEPEVSPWDWGFRFRLRETYIVNPLDLDSSDRDDWQFFRYRTQLWGAYTPNEWWKAHAMMTSETRSWIKPEGGPSGEGFEWGEIICESLYLEGKTLNYTPYGFKVGRQNLFYGEGLICWDGGPLDGSRTAYFNAALLTADWEGRSLDAHFIYDTQVDEFPVINSQDRPLIEWDETGAGLYFTDESFDGKRLEAYYFFKHENDPDGVHPTSDIHTIGARATGRAWEAFDFGLEMASQIGDRADVSRLAWGLEFHGKYELPREMLPLDIGIGGFGLSGDAPDTEDYEGWNPVYSRWPKWSELYIYTLVNERGVAYWENIGSGWVKLAWATHPGVQIDWKFYWMWAFEPPPDPEKEVFGTGSFRGNLSALKLKWDWTGYLSGHLLWEALMPGDFYTEESDFSHFLRFEVYFRY